MIDQVLDIYAVSCYLDYSFHCAALIPSQALAIHIFLELEEYMGIKCHELSEAQLKVLENAVQEIVSAEKLPSSCQSSYHYMNNYCCTFISLGQGQNSSTFPCD